MAASQLLYRSGRSVQSSAETFDVVNISTGINEKEVASIKQVQFQFHLTQPTWASITSNFFCGLFRGHVTGSESAASILADNTSIASWQQFTLWNGGALVHQPTEYEKIWNPPGVIYVGEDTIKLAMVGTAGLAWTINWRIYYLKVKVSEAQKIGYTFIQ